MAPVILIEWSNNAQSVQQTVNALLESGNSDFVLVSQAPPPDGVPKSAYIPVAQSSWSEAMLGAIARYPAGALLLNAALGSQVVELASLFSTPHSLGKSTLSYLPLKSESCLIDFPAPSIQALIPWITGQAYVPCLAFSVKQDFAAHHPVGSSSSPLQVLSAWFVACVVQAEPIGRCPHELETKIPASLLRLAPEERARILKLMAESFNIEELFPQHKWNEFGPESMAACYHTLAAFFSVWNDLESADECLNQADRFEDSPRSLALKGIVAEKRGDILAAVANIIAALQLYESRKRSDEKHYLSFNPKDFGKINDLLKSGLSALNQRDNSTALDAFKKAIWDFDSFFNETGVAGESAQ